jgi:nucleotide-binding universal stress UspA family protein
MLGAVVTPPGRRQAVAYPVSAGLRHRVVAGVDGSPSSRRALQWALFMARALGAGVDAVAAWNISAVMAEDWVDGWDPRREAATALADTVAEIAGTRPPVPVRQTVCHGRTADVLIQASQGAQMLVLGHRKRRGLRRLPETVSSRGLDRARCPVLIVPENAPSPGA